MLADEHAWARDQAGDVEAAAPAEGAGQRGAADSPAKLLVPHAEFGQDPGSEAAALAGEPEEQVLAPHVGAAQAMGLLPGRRLSRLVS